MRISAIALGALFAVGCSSAANNKLDEIADRACACKDAECAKKIGEELAAWTREYKGSPGDQARVEKSFARTMSCLMKVGGEKMMEKAMDGMDKADEKPADPAAKPADPADKPAGAADEKPAEEKK